jgi:signal peptidase
MFLNNLHRNKQTDSYTEPAQCKLLSAETSALYEDVLSSGISLRVKVTGRSMAPFLAGGEVLTIKNVPLALLHTGDLILYKTCEESLLLHRIVRKKHKKNVCIFQTKGDASLSIDDPVSANDVLGKVSGIEKKLPNRRTSRIDMESPLQRSINYFLAVTGLYRSRLYFAVQKSGIYSSLRSLVKKTLV